MARGLETVAFDGSEKAHTPAIPEAIPGSGAYTYKYPHPAVTVDIVLFTFFNDNLNVLLIRRGEGPFANSWALPGGFVRIDERLDAAALRELEEETGVHGVYLEQLYTFGEPDRDPRERVITVVYFTLISGKQAIGLTLSSATDARDAQWWNIYELPPLAFDHQQILEYALLRLRWKLEWTALGFLLLPEEFTLTDLQRVYERVLGRRLDKRNFRRKFLEMGILEPTGNVFKGDHRPARLYRFTASAVEPEQSHRRLPYSADGSSTPR